MGDRRHGSARRSDYSARQRDRDRSARRPVQVDSDTGSSDDNNDNARRGRTRNKADKRTMKRMTNDDVAYVLSQKLGFPVKEETVKDLIGLVKNAGVRADSALNNMLTCIQKLAANNDFDSHNMLPTFTVKQLGGSNVTLIPSHDRSQSGAGSRPKGAFHVIALRGERRQYSAEKLQKMFRQIYFTMDTARNSRMFKSSEHFMEKILMPAAIYNPSKNFDVKMKNKVDDFDGRENSDKLMGWLIGNMIKHGVMLAKQYPKAMKAVMKKMGSIDALLSGTKKTTVMESDDDSDDEEDAEDAEEKNEIEFLKDQVQQLMNMRQTDKDHGALRKKAAANRASTLKEHVQLLEQEKKEIAKHHEMEVKALRKRVEESYKNAYKTKTAERAAAHTRTTPAPKVTFNPDNLLLSSDDEEEAQLDDLVLNLKDVGSEHGRAILNNIANKHPGVIKEMKIFVREVRNTNGVREINAAFQKIAWPKSLLFTKMCAYDIVNLQYPSKSAPDPTALYRLMAMALKKDRSTNARLLSTAAEKANSKVLAMVVAESDEDEDGEVVENSDDEKDGEDVAAIDVEKERAAFSTPKGKTPRPKGGALSKADSKQRATRASSKAASAASLSFEKDTLSSIAKRGPSHVRGVPKKKRKGSSKAD